MAKKKVDLFEDGYKESYLKKYPDHIGLVKIADHLIEKHDGVYNFSNQVSVLIRTAFDEVIDMPRTGRWSVKKLEKTEKTYIGTKVEILFRNFFNLPKGRQLDLFILDSDVDVKFTSINNWTIPPEAFDKYCLLLKGSDEKAKYSVGLFWAKEAFLNPSTNRDGKKTIAKKTSFDTIYWFAKDKPMHENFFLSLDEDVRDKIINGKSGASRVRELFRSVTNKKIHRSSVEGVARQKDFMKRVRSNGGARETLWPDYLILSGKYHKDIIAELKLPECTSEDFISISSDDVKSLGRDDILSEYESSMLKK